MCAIISIHTLPINTLKSKNNYCEEQMLSLYEERHPYGATKEECVAGLTNFSVADAEPDPICLQGKVWQLVKLDFTEQ